MKKPKSNLTAHNDKEYCAQVKRAQYVINSGYFKKNLDLDIVSARRLVRDYDYNDLYRDYIGEYGRPIIGYNEKISRCLTKVPVPKKLVSLLYMVMDTFEFYSDLTIYVICLKYLDNFTNYDTLFFRAMVAIYRKEVVHDLLESWILYGSLPEKITIDDLLKDKCLFKDDLTVDCKLDKNHFDMCAEIITTMAYEK